MKLIEFVMPFTWLRDEKQVERVEHARSARFGPPPAKVPFKKTPKLTGAKKKPTRKVAKETTQEGNE